MTLFVLLAGGLLAYFVWKSSAPIRAGGWRVGAGLTAVLLVVVGAVVAIKGDEWVGLPLVAGGLLLAFAGRVNRGGARAAAEAMDLAEARSILGVPEEATQAQIKAAYMRLMKMNHPDQGGTSGLASKLNAARARLLKEK